MPWNDENYWMRRPDAKRGFALVGAAVRRRRQRRGLTQRDLERLTGVHQSTISRLETGTRCGLKWSRFALIVGVLGGLDFDEQVGRPDLELFGPYGLSPNPTVATQQLDAAETMLQAARDALEYRNGASSGSGDPWSARAEASTS